MKVIKKLFGFFWDRSLLVFAIIGGLNTLCSTGISFVLENVVGWPLFPSMAVAFAVCSVASFYFNRKYSFKSKAPLGQSILRFSLVVTGCFLLSFGINNLLMPWARAALFPGIPDMWYSLVRIVGVQVVFTVLNYIGQRLWAFKSDDKSEDAPESTNEAGKTTE